MRSFQGKTQGHVCQPLEAHVHLASTRKTVHKAGSRSVKHKRSGRHGEAQERQQLPEGESPAGVKKAEFGAVVLRQGQDEVPVVPAPQRGSGPLGAKELGEVQRGEGDEDRAAILSDF